MGIIITWDNADDFKLKRKKFTNVKNGKSYYLQEECQICKNPYFSAISNSKYCSNKCSSIITNDKNRLRYENVKKLVEDSGFYLLDKEYKSNTTPLKVKCKKCGNISYPTYGNLQRGQTNCEKCLGKQDKTWDDVLELFNNYNFELLSSKDEFKSANFTKLRYKCKNCDFRSEISYTGLKSKGRKCPNCTERGMPNKILFSDIKQWFEDEGWVVHSTKSDYKNQNTTPIDCSCPNDHRQMKSVRKWRLGRRCPYCNGSGNELEIRKFLEDIGFKGKYNDRKKLNGTELDFYFPELNKAIEFNGDYWHCNYNKYNENYFHMHKGLYASELWIIDYKKRKNCKNLGIELLTVWEHHWKNYNKDAKNMIRNFLS